MSLIRLTNRSALTLLVASVAADHTDDAVAPHHFAVTADFLYGSPDFHCSTSCSMLLRRIDDFLEFLRRLSG
jgi:hypothetical protein